MALFGMAAVAAKEIPRTLGHDDIRAELQAMKDTVRIRARHGQHITDDQVSVYLSEENDMKIRKAKAKEAADLNRQNEIRIEGEIRALACELVKKGSILVSVDGLRVKSLTPDLIILCPHCGKPLGDLSEYIRHSAYTYFWTPEPDRLEAFRIYSARSPLTESGFSGFVQYNCLYCHERVNGIAQMVMI